MISLAAGEAKTVGRSVQADVMIDEPSLSRLHARVSMTAAGLARADDLGSTNGIFVNGVQQQSAALAVGDRVRFGFLEYCVEELRAVEPAVTEQTMFRRPATMMDSSVSVDSAALAGLLATSRELMATTDLPGLLDRVLDRLQPILKPDRSAILLFDASTGELTPRAVRPRGAYTSVSDFASATAVREAIRARDVLEVHDAALDARLQDAVSIARAGVRSALVVPLLGRAGPIGALYADRTVFAGRFTPAQTQIAAAFAANAAAALETAQLYDDRERLFRATLETFAKAIDARDHYTAGHSERVTAYTLVLARTVGVVQDQLETIRRAGMLHDIGKVGVPDAVLLKPGRLDDAERALMEAHVTIGYDMLVGLPFLTDALPIIRGHHERWDGKGYPDRIGGADIHAYSRLMSVADSYDAMTSARPYRQALPAEEAARRLRVDSGKQFEAEAIAAFDSAESEFDMIRQRANR
jgi:HD-GYP domain-containing protein (c-di-GMP phosphodiesterase class II)